jgi:cytidylate kinase
VKRLVIAIDGPSGAGKSSVGRRLAQQLGYVFLDTGAMYRALALKALRGGVSLDSGAELAELLDATRIELEPAAVRLDGEDVSAAIRAPQISVGASRVSVHSEVRRRMVAQQRAMARAGGVVMDGRDIGTRVFPDADLKLYVDAHPRRRAERRCQELRAAGNPADLDQVEREVRERDHADATRADSPLLRAQDAVLVDTTDLGPDEVLTVLLREVDRVLAAGARLDDPRSDPR